MPLLSSLGGEKSFAKVDTPVWRNPDKPVEERVRDLIGQLTPTEEISLLYWLAPAINRLGIPAYDHGNKCLHGLVRPGKNTSFPQSIALGATFDPDLVQSMASAISDEARARWNASAGQHLGTYSDVLTLWSPVINMTRDPRWGRTQETYIWTPRDSGPGTTRNISKSSSQENTIFSSAQHPMIYEHPKS